MVLWIRRTIVVVVLLFVGTTAEEYTDEYEDGEPCYPHACEFGECIPEGNSFRCECRKDHVGETCNIWRSSLVNCEVDGPLRCFNGGVCNTTKNSFTCVCPPNFTGFFCEEDVNECEDAPCQNGGTCVNRAGSFFCMCPQGFKGKLCAEPVKICSADTCKNGGTCMNAVEGFVCLCPSGFNGQHCEQLKEGFVWKNKAITGKDIARCAVCVEKAGNGHCDSECDLPECNYDGGDCLYKNPFHACPNATFCTLAFHNGICNEICDKEVCLFDGFDCVPKEPVCPQAISAYCKKHKADEICDEECNQEGCDYDGGDCTGISTKILSGELSIVVLTDPTYFIANTARFLHSLNKILRARIRIKRDQKGAMLFMWHDGKMGDRVKFEHLDFTSHSFRNGRHGVIVFVEVDISGCVKECFTDVEVVASFIEAAKEKLTGMNMSIYSVDAKKPSGFRRGLDITLIVLVACIVLMITITIVFMIHQKPNRKRKVIENAPVWIPPTEQEVEKANRNVKDWKQRVILESAKRRRIDSSDMKLLDEQLMPDSTTVSRVFAKPKAKKSEPTRSRLHIEAASTDPITIPIAAEDVNRRGPNGWTPVMELIRNTKKTEEQVLEDLTRLRSAGADLDLWDDSDDTALHVAVSSGRVNLVKKLLQLGASPIVRDHKNSTCLHLAARMCALAMVKMLLENEDMKSEVDAVDDDNRTALMLVAMHDRVDTKIAELLCQAGANVNYDGDNNMNSWTGRTALHFAAKYGNTKMVAFLLSQGANKDSQDHECCTPLHLAASEGNEGPVKELIKSGASVMLRNDKSQTPYDTALINNREGVAALLASGDNLRVQLYSNNGEIFASSTPPGFKCAKLLMARHTRSVRVAAIQASGASPRSTQSTPTRRSYNSPSPYSNLNTPHSVVATFLSPQFSTTTPGSMHASCVSSRDVQPLVFSVPRVVTEMQQPTIHSPRHENGYACYAQAEKSISVHSAHVDSGFGTFSDSSIYENSVPWRSNGKIYEIGLSPQQRRQCLEGFTV